MRLIPFLAVLAIACGPKTAPVESDPVPTVEDETPECPPAQQTADMCAQVVTWAKNPADGTCCPYNTPCEPPPSWEKFTEEGCGASATPISTVSCASKLLLPCGDGQTDGCKLTRPDGSAMTTMHVCVPDTEKDGPPCTQELAKDCPEGQVDACLVNASDVHICIEDTRK